MVRGRKRDLSTARKVEANLSASIHNRFDVEVIDARTGEVRQRAQAENVICEQLWTRLFTPVSYFNYIHYGTGTGTPAEGDTSLFNFLGGISVKAADAVADVNYSEGWYSRRSMIQLAETIAVGQVLTEVGIAYSGNEASLCTHAMLKDMNGNTISIEKTETDVVNIYATVFIHWPSSLAENGIQITPIKSATTGFLAYLAGQCDPGYAGCPQYAELVTSRLFWSPPSYSSDPQYQTGLIVKYDKGMRTITLDATRVPVGVGNWPGGSRGIALSIKSDKYPVFFLESGHTWFSGTSIQGEAIGTGDGTTQDFHTAFDDPQNAKVYVNGVLDPEAQVECIPCAHYQNMGRYFNAIVIESDRAHPSFNDRIEKIGSNGSIPHGYYENPYWRAGIKQVYCSYVESVAVSDDLVHWDYVIGSEQYTRWFNGVCEIPEGKRNKRFWKVSCNTSTSGYLADSLTGKNIHFPTPPPAGAVITADYTTKCIAKDANHVFDLTVTIHLGEYQA